MGFLQKYPLNPRQLINTPMIFRENTSLFGLLPYPNLAGIRDIAEYGGISYSAIRTAISRARATHEILSFTGEDNQTRYKVSPETMQMGMTTVMRTERPEGFILAVFSFKKEEETGRKSLRETLKYFGFQKLAQNTYINGRIPTHSLMKRMQELDVADHLYLFHCPNIDDPALIKRILTIFDMEGRKNELLEFQKDLTAFLTEKGIDDMELARRIFYSGPVHYLKCFVDEPPFPEKYLPEDYPLQTVSEYFNSFVSKNEEKLVRYYMAVNL